MRKIIIICIFIITITSTSFATISQGYVNYIFKTFGEVATSYGESETQRIRTIFNKVEDVDKNYVGQRINTLLAENEISGVQDMNMVALIGDNNLRGS